MFKKQYFLFSVIVKNFYNLLLYYSCMSGIVDLINLIFCHFFTRETTFNDFLLTFLHTKPPSQKVFTLKGKSLFPIGANSFLWSRRLFRREANQFKQSYIP